MKRWRFSKVSITFANRIRPPADVLSGPCSRAHQQQPQQAVALTFHCIAGGGITHTHSLYSLESQYEKDALHKSSQQRCVNLTHCRGHFQKHRGGRERGLIEGAVEDSV